MWSRHTFIYHYAANTYIHVSSTIGTFDPVDFQEVDLNSQSHWFI